MAIKLNWDRVKQLNAELTIDGWQEDDRMIFVLIDVSGKTKKMAIQFKELYKFCYTISGDELLTFIIQDFEGKILYRHRQMVDNEEIPNGGSSDVIIQWAALTQDEKDMYVNILAAQIDAYER